jgi:hypothetical protein
MKVIVRESLAAYWEGESYAPTPGEATELLDGLAQALIAAGQADAVNEAPAKPARKKADAPEGDE